MPKAETMGQKLKRLREAREFSQEELAVASGVQLGTIRNWEQDRTVPLLDTAAKVAGALGCSLDDLADVKAMPKKKTRKKKGE